MPSSDVHQLKEKTGPSPKAGVTPNSYIAKCGAESKDGVNMTAWASEVTCVVCRG